MSGREAWSPRRPPGLKLWRYAAHDMSIEASRLLEARGSAYRAALTLLPGHRDESAATLQVSTTVLRIGSKAVARLAHRWYKMIRTLVCLPVRPRNSVPTHQMTIQRKNWLKDSFSGSRRIYAGDGRDDRYYMWSERREAARRN